MKNSLSGAGRTKLIILVFAGTVAIGVGVAMVLATLSVSPESDSDPRTVFWRHIHGLGIDPNDRNILYIATHGDFYQSVNDGPPIKVDEQRADYMAFNAPYVSGMPLYASGHPATGGKTWQQVATILDPPVDFHAMGVSKSDPNTIIGFDSGGRGLFKTIDSGLNWQKLDLPEYISAIAISPTDSGVIFAGTGKGICQSSDGAQSWNHIEQYDGLLVLALSFDENGILYAFTDKFGLSKSADLGKTWVKIDTPDLTIMSITSDAQNNILYVAGCVPDGFQEVYKSSDGGNTWILIGTNKEL